jgi:hypothetical protein
MSGYILHQDSQRVVIATDTRESDANEKTGRMIQVYILTAEESPLDAVRDGSDSLICGDCPLRGKDPDNGFVGRTCYVRVIQGPLAVWRAWQRGAYPYLPRTRYADLFSGRAVRWGAYGDPAFIPLEVIRWVSFFAKRHTGYTHQWKHNPQLRAYLMASVDSEVEYYQAKAAGWRTFRVRAAGERLQAREISCPASAESGHKTQCVRCGLCDGARDNDCRKDISIVVHGVGRRNFVPLAILGG